MIAGIAAHGLRSGVRQTAKAGGPPSRSTRRVSLSAAAGSAISMLPQRQTAPSTLSSSRLISRRRSPGTRPGSGRGPRRYGGRRRASSVRSRSEIKMTAFARRARRPQSRDRPSRRRSRETFRPAADRPSTTSQALTRPVMFISHSRRLLPARRHLTPRRKTLLPIGAEVRTHLRSSSLALDHRRDATASAHSAQSLSSRSRSRSRPLRFPDPQAVVASWRIARRSPPDEGTGW